MNKSKTFLDLVNASGMEAVEHIMRRGRQLQRFDKLLKSILPAELQTHCQLANIKGSTAIVLVSSTVWATRIRYQIPSLINKLQQDSGGRKITDIEIRVQPESISDTRERPTRRASMSKEAALSVQRCAASVDDEKLRSALERLASRKGVN